MEGLLSTGPTPSSLLILEHLLRNRVSFVLAIVWSKTHFQLNFAFKSQVFGKCIPGNLTFKLVSSNLFDCLFM